MFGVALLPKAPPVEAKAVSSTRLYVKINDSIIARASAYKLYTGSADVDLIKLSPSDNYMYYTDAAITNTMTFKNNGGNSINLYDIFHSGVRSTWDLIDFGTGTITNWSTPATVTKSVYVPPGVQYTVSLYNGATLLGTQTAYEGTQFTPTNIPVNDYAFGGWYTDAALTVAYTPTVLTANTSLYGKYTPIDLNYTIRLYVESTNSWWYNASAAMAIYYWKTGVSAQVQTMRREVGNLHSVILPNASFTHIKLERRNPASPFNAWNATGDIAVNLGSFNVIKLSGALDNNYTGPMTATDFSNTAPDIAYLKTEVPLLSCTNYGNANTLLEAYNRLGNNELSLINALTVNSHDETPIALSYKSVIDYYAAYQNVKNPPGPSQIFQTSTRNNIALFSLLGLSIFALSSYYFIKKKKYLTD